MLLSYIKLKIYHIFIPINYIDLQSYLIIHIMYKFMTALLSIHFYMYSNFVCSY